MQVLELLNCGGWGNGDVYRVCLNGQRGILKTYADKPWPTRLLGRYLLARERHAYARLKGLAGIPHLLPHSVADSLVIGEIQGEKISNRLLQQRGDLIVPSLRRLIDAMHQRGVYHMDLRNQGNILIDAEYQAHAVDFASSVRLKGGNMISRALARLCRRFDLYAYAKWAGRAERQP